MGDSGVGLIRVGPAGQYGDRGLERAWTVYGDRSMTQALSGRSFAGYRPWGYTFGGIAEALEAAGLPE
jgi:hypothetical protein